MATCKQCGYALPADSSFCTFCGAPVPQEPIPTVDDFPPVPPVYDVPAVPPAYADSPQTDANPFAPQEYTPAAPPIPPYGAPPVPPIRTPKRVGPDRINFANGFLTIMLLGIFLSVAISLGIYGNSMFISIESINGMFKLFCMYGMIAVAAAVSSRAKGPDLSIGSLTMLSGVIFALNFTAYGSPFTAMLIAMAVCAIIGLINGILINYVSIPALMMTLLTSLIVRYVGFLLTNTMDIIVKDSLVRSLYLGIGPFTFLAIAFIVAFFMILPSKLGTPIYRREKKHPVSYMFAYMISGLIAALMGIMLVSRLGAADSTIGTGFEPFILLVYGCVAGSRALDNRIAPALYALAPALLFAISSYTLNLLNVQPFIQSIIISGLALVFILVAHIVRPELRGKILMPKQ